MGNYYLVMRVKNTGHQIWELLILKKSNSLFLKRLIKKNWILIKKIKGSISKIRETELSKDKYRGK